jgi:hypothetical protein
LVIATKRRLWRLRVLHAITALGVIGVPAMIWAWNGDGQEVTRHTVEGLAEIHLAALLMLLYVTLWPGPWLSATSSRSSATSPRNPARAESS